MREVTLRIRHHGAPESDISAQFPTLTVRTVSALTGSTTERKRIHEIVGPEEDIKGFIEELKQTDQICDARLLSEPQDNHAFAEFCFDGYQWDSIIQRLVDFGVHFRVGTTITAGWEIWTLFLDDENDLSAIIEDIEQAGNEVELIKDVSLSEVSGRMQLAFSRIRELLTERQREVLLTAVELDYYGPDSSGSIEDVAQAVDLAQTTTWEHLVRAEQKVVEEIGANLDAYS